MSANPIPSDYTVALGGRLRTARENAGMPKLPDAEAKSGGRWKAAVLASYERGDRRVSPEGLLDLAALFGTDPAWLLTGDEPEPTLVARAFTAITASAAGAVRQQLLERALREGGDDLYLAIRGFLEVAS